MVEYAPIRDLIEQMPAEARELLEQINERRRGMLAGELLANRKWCTQPERREPRSLKNHPLNPPRVR
jgi:hypothetical protein